MVGLARILQRPGALVAVLAGLGGGVLTLGTVAFLLLHRKDVASCSYGYALAPPLDALFVLACVLSFFAGGVLSGAPGLTRPPDDTRGPSRSQPSRILEVLLVLVVAVLTVLMAYETWSLSPLNSHPTQVWPLTYFVRCASRVASAGTLLVAIGLSAFFGKWLWYRPLR